MPESSSGTQMSDNPRKPLLVVGIVFLVLALLGFVAALSLPWFNFSMFGESESFSYFDFGEKFEEEMSSRLDEYYHWSANVSLIGLISIIILSSIALYEYRKGRITKIISNRWLKNFTSNYSQYSSSIFVIIIGLLLLIPIFLTIIGGIRFVGFVNMLQAEQQSVDELSDSDDSFSFGTLNGYIISILGFIFLIICIIVIYREFNRIIYAFNSQGVKVQYLNKVKIFGTILIIFTIIGMIFFPVLSFMTMERRFYANEEVYRSDTVHYNDYFINLWARSGYGDDSDDAVENVDRDIYIMFWSLAVMLILFILLMVGLLLFSIDKFPRGANILIMFGTLALIFCLLILLGFAFMANDINKVDEEIQRENDLYYQDRSWGVEVDMNLGNNFIPVIFGFMILVVCLVFTYTIWPLAMPLIISRPVEDVTRVPGRTTRFLAKPTAHKVIIGVVVVFAMIFASSGSYFALSGTDYSGGGLGDGPTEIDYRDLGRMDVEYSFGEYSPENTEYDIDLTLDNTDYVVGVVLMFEWTDEADESFRHENEPDEFYLAIWSPEGEYYESPIVANDKASKQGEIYFSTGTIDPPVGWEEDEYFENSWRIGVFCCTCGDHEAQNFGVLKFNDNGNYWQLRIFFDCYQNNEEL